ncbi:unnamed protein product [Vicia faba]|uniref:Uncharacterized protein n=1 Tax=Vicia faba TaxID=3906 RepID=A0AAV1A1Z2_VICFA|nr:unnamed protein product [Vicia faba]
MEKGLATQHFGLLRVKRVHRSSLSQSLYLNSSRRRESTLSTQADVIISFGTQPITTSAFWLPRHRSASFRCDGFTSYIDLFSEPSSPLFVCSGSTHLLQSAQMRRYGHAFNTFSDEDHYGIDIHHFILEALCHFCLVSPSFSFALHKAPLSVSNLVSHSIESKPARNRRRSFRFRKNRFNARKIICAKRRTK